MTLSTDTTNMLAAAIITLMVSFAAITVSALLMRNMAVVLSLFGIDVGDE